VASIQSKTAETRQNQDNAKYVLDYLPDDLRANGQKMAMPAGTQIFREGEPCSSFMLLLEGCVRVYKNSDDGREITLYRVCPGEFCVLSLHSLMCNEGFSAEAIADSDLVGIAINAKDFQRAMDASPDLRNYLLKTLTQRLGETVQLVSEVTFYRLDLRLACLLGQLFERSDGKPLRVTHAKLARELGTAREMISRILKEFENQGCVILNRNEIRLVSSEGLSWFGR